MALTLVLGGNGKTGRRLVGRMTKAGQAARIGSRRGEAPFDWQDRGSWGGVLRGDHA